MKTDALSDIRARLWNSLEMSHVRMQFLVWAVAYGFCLVLFWFRAGVIPMVRPMMMVFTSVMFLPPVGFWLLRMWKIFRSPGAYIFCRTELNQPRHAPLRREMFSFMGVIETGDDRFAVETYAIFAGRGIVQPLMEDYIGRTVTIAWNRETEMVVVIG